MSVLQRTSWIGASAWTHARLSPPALPCPTSSFPWTPRVHVVGQASIVAALSSDLNKVQQLVEQASEQVASDPAASVQVCVGRVGRGPRQAV